MKMRKLKDNEFKILMWGERKKKRKSGSKNCERKTGVKLNLEELFEIKKSWCKIFKLFLRLEFKILYEIKQFWKFWLKSLKLRNFTIFCQNIEQKILRLDF